MSANPSSISGAIHDSIKPTRQNHQGKSLGGVSPSLFSTHSCSTHLIRAFLVDFGLTFLQISQHEKLRTNTGNDSKPEFHAQKLDAGSAPKDKTYQPNPISETPGQTYPSSSKETWTYADATLNGSSSKDIYNMPNMGKPLQGQTHADKQKHGQHGYGIQGRPVAMGETSEKETMGFNEDPNRQKMGKTGNRVGKGTRKNENLVDLGTKEPKGIETVA